LRTIQFDESVKLGERLLNQALSSFGIDPETINDTQWERLVRESGAKSKKALLADIALGKQLSAVVAKRLVVPGESVSEISSSSNPVTILGTEGMTVQFAR